VSDPIPFPTPALSDDEKLARLRAKAEALASKSAFEWKFFLPKHAADIGVSPDELEAAIKEIVKLRREDTKAQSERQRVEARNLRWRQSREKSRAALFRQLAPLRSPIAEELAPEPVNGLELVEMIRRRIHQYCVLKPEVETVGLHPLWTAP
jgi:hypothetical protein